MYVWSLLHVIYGVPCFSAPVPFTGVGNISSVLGAYERQLYCPADTCLDWDVASGEYTFMCRIRDTESGYRPKIPTSRAAIAALAEAGYATGGLCYTLAANSGGHRMYCPPDSCIDDSDYPITCRAPDGTRTAPCVPKAQTCIRQMELAGYTTDTCADRSRYYAVTFRTSPPSPQ